MYPLKMAPYYVEKVWGGRRLETIRDDLPSGKIGELWALSIHNYISNGPYSGQALGEIIELHSQELLGGTYDRYNFPLMLKYLDANEILSLQIHPGDGYARDNEKSQGKSEAWIILDANHDSELILGTNTQDRDRIHSAITNHKAYDIVNRIKVNTGDVYFIPSGLIHTMKGVLVLEIQQNSDITYRIDDGGRGRQLHLSKALDVLDPHLSSNFCIGKTIIEEGHSHTSIMEGEYFAIDSYQINSEVEFYNRQGKFSIITITKGSGILSYMTKGKNNQIRLERGETLLMPVSLFQYRIEGNLMIYSFHVPSENF